MFTVTSTIVLYIVMWYQNTASRYIHGNPHNAEIFLYYPWNSKGVFQFEIIINAIGSSFRFLYMPLVYGHYKYFNSFSVGIVFICQNRFSNETERAN